MKISTRARYGLRMMIELARELQKTQPVHLGRIARVTGISENYLAQLAIPLKNNGLLAGVSGKGGGYVLAKPPEDIKIREIVRVLIGPINLTDCSSNPHVCLHSPFCESRVIWVLINHGIQRMLDQYSLRDLMERGWIEKMKLDHPDVPGIDPAAILDDPEDTAWFGCPGKAKSY